MRVRNVPERWKIAKITTVEWHGWWGVTPVSRINYGLHQPIAVFPTWRQCVDFLYARLVSDE